MTGAGFQWRGHAHRWLGSYSGAQVMDSVPLCVRSVRDVTAQYELEARHKAIFDVRPTAISLLRLDALRFTKVNEGFLRLTGYSREGVIDKTAGSTLAARAGQARGGSRAASGGHEDAIIEHEATLGSGERKRAENELAQSIQEAIRDPLFVRGPAINQDASCSVRESCACSSAWLKA